MKRSPPPVSSTDVIDVLTDLFILRVVLGYIRSDNGPEFFADAVRPWITAVGAQTAFIEPGSPWENGYIESFNARLRDELLNGEILYTLKEDLVLIESWRCHYNAIHSHGSLGYWPPAPETIIMPSWPANPQCTNIRLGPVEGGWSSDSAVMRASAMNLSVRAVVRSWAT